MGEPPRMPSGRSSSDSATLVFSAVGADALWAERGACAVRLAAVALRPWPSASDHGRWTVRIALTEAGATVYRLGSESARDAIDAGIALFATEDLDLVAYATARPELEVSPLPWDRMYLRLAPGAGAPLGAERARDAVRVDARPADLLPCDTALSDTTSASAAGSSTRVVYDSGDPTARELAERIVALTGGRTVGAGLGPAELEAGLHAGNELAYIVSVPRSADGGCDALAALRRRAPWLTQPAITPLVETRAHAILPRTSRP